MREGIWLHTLLNNIHTPLQMATTIFCNNNATITLSNDPLLHAHVKHIDIKYHFLRECVQSQELVLAYIHTKDNLADIFTKALEPHQFQCLCNFLGRN